MEMDGQADQNILEDEEQFMISVEKTLSNVENSIQKFMKDIPQVLADSGLNLDFEKLNLQDDPNFQVLMQSYPQSHPNHTAKEEKTEKIATLELECKRLRDQLQQQIETNKKAQEEMEYLREQILNQSTYCASMGAVLGNLTWRASRFPEIVNLWLSSLQFQNKIGELLMIADGSFAAFINTYRNAFPPTSNVEYQFIIGLLGIMTNITASPEGREFLITNPSGKEFVEKMVKLMPTLPLSQGSLSFKRLMLMILYNVSVNKTGLQHLFESRVDDVLNYYLKNNSVPDEIQLLCLRVLQSITYGITNPKHIHDLITTLPIHKIEDIAARMDRNEMSSIAKQVIKQLKDSQKYINSK